MSDPNRKQPSLRGLWLAAALVLAFGLGAYSSRGPMLFKGTSFERFDGVLQEVLNTYVDKPDLEKLEAGAIEGMLKSLDPHSVYIPPRDQVRISEELDGEFTGIGIQFDLQDDGIVVVSPIPGTPAARLGMRAGDRIIAIEGVSTFGITNQDVIDKLRGPKGTQVTVTVKRPTEREPFDLTITRGKIPIHSVEAAFMLADGKTGYVMINQFTSVTADELELALKTLESRGMEALLLDLRGNSGGYLGQADEVADRFIEGGLVIVTTDGRARGTDSIRRASDSATRPYYPVIVLVNSGSASASEIVSGAIQDHDRGLVVGEPTFGKGLVQQPLQLDDGAVVRLTTSRWFTPSGRCVQRPYGETLGEYYNNALEQDTSNVEIPDTAEVFLTRTGRKVYGWRGIQPDYIVDPGSLSELGSKLVRQRVLINWARDYAEDLKMLDMPFARFRDEWVLSASGVRDLRRYAEKEGIKWDEAQWREDRSFLLTQVKAEIAQRVYNGRDYLWQILVTDDAQIDEALRRIEEADSLARTPSEDARG
ncbi:PDZ domain-containing protein [bacterium]|nr:PDZ domain-containing protein [bacterium]